MLKADQLNILFNAFSWIIKVAAILIFISCNAPRNNPLDPLNPNNKLASIEGTVQTLSLPYTGISDAQVYWVPGERLILTDINGRFVMDNLNPIAGELIISKEGFLSDTVKINWANTLKAAPQINLNSLPILDSISIYTEVINPASSQANKVAIVTKINDNDNDIDSTYVENLNLNLRKKMDFDPSEKTYSIQLALTDLNLSDIEETIGLIFNIFVIDKFHNKFMIGSDEVKRVIKSEVQIISPANNEIIVSPPVLSWEKVITGYPFTYSVEIFTNDLANAQLVFRTDGISSDSNSYITDVSLPSRDYYWVIWIIDEFQNRSRSEPAVFIKQ